MVKVIKAKSRKDSNKIGIHLFKPTVIELERAQERAERDGFNVIYTHIKRTWPKPVELAASTLFGHIKQH